MCYMHTVQYCFSLRKEGNSIICHDMHESWGYGAKWNKPGTEDNNCMIPFIWSIYNRQTQISCYVYIYFNTQRHAAPKFVPGTMTAIISSMKSVILLSPLHRGKTERGSNLPKVAECVSGCAWWEHRQIWLQSPCPPYLPIAPPPLDGMPWSQILNEIWYLHLERHILGQWSIANQGLTMYQF